MRSFLAAVTASVCLSVAMPVAAGFSSTEVFLPSVGRITGQGGAQFFTTVWATNLTPAPESFTFQFLKAGQANPSPASFADTLAPGQTKVYENVVETKLGLSNALGAARVTSTGEILVAERIFDQEPGTDLGQTEGLFFAAVPASFAISAGQSASIQGVDQGSSEDFRYNFALVETAGQSADVNVQVFDGSGVLLGQKAFPLSAFEQVQPNVADVVPGFSSTNARITATVTGGSGHVLLAGAQVANVSQDSSGFEMSFRDDLLGGGGGGLSAVSHDASLIGDGTAGSPLAIADGQVVRSLNGLHDAVTLVAGSNVTITSSGTTLTIASSGSGSGGLSSVSHDFTLVGNGTGAQPLGLAVPIGSPIAISGGQGTPFITVQNNAGPSIQASSSNGDAIVAQSDAGPAIAAGTSDGNAIDASSSTGTGMFAHTDSGIGVIGNTNTGDAGVIGAQGGGSGLDSGVFAGVIGDSNAGNGVVGLTGSSPAGVVGRNKSANADTSGVLGIDGTGVSGQSGSLSAGVYGESSSHIGVQGRTGSGAAGVRGLNSSSANDTSGVFGRDGTGTAGITALPSAGVRGESKTNVGVVGLSGSDIGVFGLSNSIAVAGSVNGDLAVRGELGSHEETKNWAVYGFGNAKFNGTMTATGTKSFLEPHPTDPTKEIRFVCLEGPESGTYFRGHGHIVGGFAKIGVPESFRMVTDPDNLTVQLTPMGGLAVLACVRKGLDEIVVQGSSDVDFDYLINGVRKAYRDFRPIEENEGFVPDGPDDRRFALYAPELQRRLVATGIYNADGTVNLETAKRLGWDRRWAREDPAR